MKYKKDKQILELMVEMLNLIYLHGHFLGESDYYKLVDKMNKLYNEPDFRTNPQTGERYCATCGNDLDENGKCKCNPLEEKI